MFEFLRPYHLVYNLLVVVLSALVTWMCIPSILHVARARHLYDDIGHFRKEHDHGIPRLGGVAIFISFNITSLLFGIIDKSLPFNDMLAACIILFVLGLKDDLSGVNPSTKFMIQAFVAAVLAVPADIRVTSMYGIFGIYNLPYIPSVLLSVLLIMLIVNSFNLIDGINGLAATTGIIANCTFAFLFICLRQYELAAIGLTMSGAILGFLRFNLTPARIFMGDTGALMIGLISAVMALKFISLSTVPNNGLPPMFYSPAMVIAILAGPVFDTLRVFILRLTKGKSPFEADRNHIHHRLLELGLNHGQATLFLSVISLLSIGGVFLFSGLGNSLLISLIFCLFAGANWGISILLRGKKRRDAVFRRV